MIIYLLLLMNTTITRFLSIYFFFYFEINKNKIIPEKAIYCQNHPFKSLALGVILEIAP